MAGHVDCQVAHPPTLFIFQDDRVLQYPPVKVDLSSVNDCIQVLVLYCKLFIS